MTIRFAMLRFGDVPYSKYSMQLNHAYCRRHGYTLDVIVPPRQVERHPVWFKLKGVEQLLPTSDYVVFLDADAYVMDQDRRVEDLISEHLDGKVLLLGTDRRDADFTHGDHQTNTGVFVIKNDPVSYRLLAEWWNAPKLHSKVSLWTWPVEQLAFNNYVLNGKHKDQIKVVYYSIMNGRDGTFIKHLIGMPEEERLRILRQDALERG